MVGFLLITHGALGEALLRAAGHTLGRPLERAEHISVSAADAPESMLARAREAIARIDDGSGVLVIADMYGATPANVAAKLLANGRVEGLAGANLPMLVRALAHRDSPLREVLEKARAGGVEGVVYMNADRCRHG
ncbi:MAG TPA: PTS fructose transporter subunit IIA [Burkholderiales bacterium]|nr:PTS fructose transporter subunit IIA [Burkholderiales bacterium]